MRIIQLCRRLTYGDGMGNAIILMDKVISRNYNALIAVKQMSSSYCNHKRIVQFNNIEELDIHKEDIVIYHFGGADDLGNEIISIKCKRIILYQNVTYPYFYNGIDDTTLVHCAEGQRYIRNVVGCFLKAIAPSSFSFNELVDMGWNKKDVHNLPLPVSLDSKNTSFKKTDKKRKFLFVGRVVPNKKIEDVIHIFDYYKNYYYEETYLKIIGSYSDDAYYSALKKYIRANDINNIEFLNHVSNEELEQAYIESDVYLCMSEHEGFCMPLIEAMSYKVPVIAYAATAVPDTMGNAGILVEKKDARYVCGKIDRLFEDNHYHDEIIKLQNRHIDSFIRKDYEKELLRIIEEINNTSEYEYDYSRFEFYRILSQEINERSEKELVSQINRLSDIENGIVLYGMGKAGEEVYEMLKRNCIEPIAVCDMGRAGEKMNGKVILSPMECVQKYAESLYIITVQKETVASTILNNLVDIGVQSRKVFFYSMRHKKIYI